MSTRNGYLRKRQKKRYKARLKVRAYNCISNYNIRCAYCGCGDIRLLEINHINGGGGKERKKWKHHTDFYQSIASGKRTVDDLELTCRVCNARHYLELLYGKQPYAIIWNGTILPPIQLNLNLEI